MPAGPFAKKIKKVNIELKKTLKKCVVLDSSVLKQGLYATQSKNKTPVLDSSYPFWVHQ